MRWLGNHRVIRILPSAILGASVVMLMAIFLLVMSMTAGNEALFAFSDREEVTLPDDKDIVGWSSFDKDSYLPGDVINYTIEVIWREGAVAPKLDRFLNSISFYPLHERSSTQDKLAKPGRLRGHVVNFELQAISADFPATLRLDPATLYYTTSKVDEAEVQVLRIAPPPLHLGEYYPRNISNISLLPPKPELAEFRWIRQGLMMLFAIMLLGIVLLLLKHYGERRPASSLTDAEQLWRQVQRARSAGKSNRELLLAYEQLFTRALELRAGITPSMFWSGRTCEQNEWLEVMKEARLAFSRAYRPSDEPATAALEQIASVILDLLDPMVATEQLEREEIVTLSKRLRRYPKVLLSATFLLFMAAIIFLLATRPSEWLSPDLRQYNQAVGLAANEATLHEALSQFENLAEEAKDQRIRAAALYNLGTILVKPRLAGLTTRQYDELLNLLFLPKVTLEILLHELELDAEFELLTILTDVTRRQVAAEQALKTAVLLRPSDAQARRNLELLTKIRKALGNTVAQLARQDGTENGPQAVSRQTIIDLKRLMETELPEDFAKSEEGKDDRHYFIMEGF